MSNYATLALKTFLYQIVMSFFGVMMFTATGKNSVLFVIGQTLVLAFYFYILFTQSKTAGEKYAEFARGHGEKIVFLPALCALFCGFLPVLLLSLSSLFAAPYYADGSGRNVIPFLLNKLLFQGMYVGIMQKIYPTVTEGAAAAVAAENAAMLNAQATLYIFTFAPGYLAAAAGYVFGVKRFSKEPK